ncbi:unnamed protein product [Musa acuminata subsp. malaccensis]|uniref:(wild Malaysian banana) hypothetical protein n=1 Tax=Musa acuminata subsp. malaccensis TaxID=214687 RepID=A0A804J9T8_MUSAM|nr:unnamed protein product [Musa acuminata subsp. malaccensis]
MVRKSPCMSESFLCRAPRILSSLQIYSVVHVCSSLSNGNFLDYSGTLIW